MQIAVFHCWRAISVRASMTVNEKERETKPIRISSSTLLTPSFLIINSVSLVSLTSSLSPTDEKPPRSHNFSFLSLLFSGFIASWKYPRDSTRPLRRISSLKSNSPSPTFTIPRGWTRTRSFPVFLARVNDWSVDI